MFRRDFLAASIAVLGLAALPAYAQTSIAYQWGVVPFGGGGFVSSIVPSRTEKGLVYARTDVGGAYRWTQSTSRWTPLLDWASESEKGLLGVESIALDPKDPSRLYLLAGTSYYNDGKTAILRSSNYGKTFTQIDVTKQFKAHGNGMGRQNGERLQVDPGSSNVLYVGTRSAGLFRSTNQGNTWTRLDSLGITNTPNDNGISFVWLDPDSVSGGVAQRIVVGVSRHGSVGPNLYVSANAGASFTAISGAPSNFLPQRAAYSPDGSLYITYANGDGPHGHQKWNDQGVQTLDEPMTAGQIWKYAVATGTWTQVTPAGYTTPFSGISVDPTNPSRLIASTINVYQQQGKAWGDQFFVSTNGGASWNNVVANGFTLNTGGASWIADQSIHWAGSIEFDPFSPSAVWVTSGNGVFRTTNVDAVPATWTFTVDRMEESVPLNFASLPGGPLISVIGDFGGFINTSLSKYGTRHSPAMGTTTGLAYAALKPSLVVRAGVGDGDLPAMYYSMNYGKSWSKTASMNGKFGQVALSANGSVLLHAPAKTSAWADSTTVYRSTDLGASWRIVGGLTSAGTRPVADQVNANKFYAYVAGKMMVSTDAGATFSAKASLASGGSNVISTVPGVEGGVWVPLNGNGLARSTDSGATFNTLPNVTYCAAVGFGKAAPGATFPTAYIWGTVTGSELGLHRSTDGGASWVRLNDNAHEFGGLGNAGAVVGDMNTFGIVYMGTAGRGLVYGKPQ